MKMCREQVGQILAYARKHGIAARVVDGWRQQEVVDHYRADFFPTLILLDGRGKEYRRFTREEHLARRLESLPAPAYWKSPQ
jgi:hypothetical protein